MTDTQKCEKCGREMVFTNIACDEGYECPATPDQHRIAELEKKLTSALEQCEAVRGAERAANEQGERDRDRASKLERELEEERHRVTCAGKHGHNPQILDCPKCVEEKRFADLQSQLRAREADVLALREALEQAPAHGYNCEGSEDDETCGYCYWHGRRKAALSTTSATAQEIVARIEHEAAEKVIKAVCTQGHNFEVFRRVKKAEDGEAAALLQVAMLRGLLSEASLDEYGGGGAHTGMCDLFQGDVEAICDCRYPDRVKAALSNTSATAQQVKEEWERGIRDAIWASVKDMWGASPMRFRAAILGEKKP